MTHKHVHHLVRIIVTIIYVHKQINSRIHETYNSRHISRFNDRQDVLCAYMVAQKYTYRPSAFRQPKAHNPAATCTSQQERERNLVVELYYSTTTTRADPGGSLGSDERLTGITAADCNGP